MIINLKSIGILTIIYNPLIERIIIRLENISGRDVRFFFRGKPGSGLEVDTDWITHGAELNLTSKSKMHRILKSGYLEWDVIFGDGGGIEHNIIENLPRMEVNLNITH
jgi:hypothetical protein